MPEEARLDEIDVKLHVLDLNITVLLRQREEMITELHTLRTKVRALEKKFPDLNTQERG